MSLPEGTSLGPFRILSFLGQGGIGEVYRARDSRLGRDVAIKVLHREWAEDPERLGRFERESRAVAQLSHANVVHLLDVGEQGGLPYLVMELLEGESLRSVLLRGPLSLKKALDLARQVVQGLTAAHDAGIVHRDLKPENIFLTREGVYKILDFGLVKDSTVAPEEDSATTSPFGMVAGSQPTQEGVMLGTLGYLSPEQVSGTHVDARADIFSFGVVLWEALAGRPPFAGETAVDTLHAILRKDLPELPAELGVPAGLERILGRCLEKDPGARFRSAHDLALALEVVGGSFTSVPFRERRARPQGRRLPPAMAIGGAVLAVCLAAIGAWQLRPDPRKGLAFVRITPRRGVVTGAAFLPGSQSILFSASPSDDAPEEVFRVDNPGELPRSLGIKGAGLLSVNDKGEFLLLLRSNSEAPSGILAVLSPNAMAPRELAHGVAWAGWGPDDTPIIKHHRYQGRRTQAIEYPKGRILYEAPYGFVVSSFTVAPDRSRIAFLEGRSTSLYVVSIQLAGGEVRRKLLGEGLSSSSWKLGWDKRGLLFMRWDPESQSARLLRLNDRLEPAAELLGLPWVYNLLACRNGSWLMAESSGAVELHWLRPQAAASIRAEWSENFYHSASLSADGNLIAGMDDRGIFVLRSGDPRPVLVGKGFFTALSADGRWILSKLDRGSAGTVFRVLPVGEGENQLLPGEWISNQAEFLPGNRQVLLSGKRTDVDDQGSFIVDLDAGTIKRITEESLMGPVSPDGTYAVQFSPRDMSFRLFNLRTLKVEPRPVAIYGKEGIGGWTADSKGLWIVPKDQPDSKRMAVHRLDLATGSSKPSHVLQLPAAHRPQSLVLSQDGRAGLVMVPRSTSGFLFLAQGME